MLTESVTFDAVWWKLRQNSEWQKSGTSKLESC